MTTRLAGRATHFLPFNQGNGTGAGNPENPGGYKTAYLWEEVWQRDSFLDILARFIHLQVEEKKVGGKKVKKETMIFPRYHQLDSVRKLVADAREQGRRAQLPGPALGRQRQEQLHRLAGPSAGQPAQREGREGLRLGHRGHRPAGARPAAAEHHLPVRAQAGRGPEDRRGLDAAGRGPWQRACRSSSPRSRSSRS